jgi:O-methyltransferase
MPKIKMPTRRRIARAFGVTPVDVTFRRDFDPDLHALLDRVGPYTMTTPERLWGLREAVDYIVREKIPGDAVECGVWRGGSSMTIALRLLAGGDPRHLWMYDTYDGMSEPTADDGEEAVRRFKQYEHRGEKWDWAPLDAVRDAMGSTDFPADRLHLVQGRVEDTLPAAIPERIGLLRLDTDWYESTLHELTHLWPRLAVGGVLIIDDYGHWEGARKAVDEFFDELGARPLMSRLDYTGRLAVKVS